MPPIDPVQYLTELEKVALTSSGPAGPICDSPPIGFPVFSTPRADLSTFIFVDVPEGIRLRGKAFFSGVVGPPVGIADDQVVRFDAYYTNLETGAETTTPDPFTLWQRSNDRPATVEDDVLLYNGFVNVGAGRIRVELRAGTEVYRGAEGEVIAFVFVTPRGPNNSPTCADLCAAEGGDLYVANSVTIRDGELVGCYFFGPQLAGFRQNNPGSDTPGTPSPTNNALTNALDAAGVVITVVTGGPAGVIPGIILSDVQQNSANDLLVLAAALE